MLRINRTAGMMCIFFSLVACGGGSSGGGSNGGGGGTNTNSAPVANAGLDRTVAIGVAVNLSGSASSDADGDTLTYSWALDSIPAASSATLSSSTGVAVELTPDVLGDYSISLVVNDGTLDSTVDQVTISVVAAIESLGLTDITLRDPGVAIVADFYTPAPIANKLSETRNVDWNESTVIPDNLTRFAFGPDGTDDLFFLDDDGSSVDSFLSVSPGLSGQNNAENNLLLSSTFQFVEVEAGKYAIYSVKHPNYALDASGNDVILNDVRSYSAYDNSTASFLTFDVGSSPLTLVANGRFTIDSAASASDTTLVYEADAGWTNKVVAFVSDALSLADTGGEPMTIYDEPIQLNIPFDFDPDATVRLSNLEYFDANPMGGVTDQFSTGVQNLDAAYAAQTSAQGPNSATRSAAESMLDQIETDLSDEGSQLRYPREFYLALREGMLERVVKSSESFAGEIGQYSTPYVYFTNETDGGGNHHPFMVIASRNLPDSLARLIDVPSPPGDGMAMGADERVTRGFYSKNYLLKIPMRDYGEVEEPGDNAGVPVLNPAAIADHHAYASTGQSAAAVDGVLVFPAYNNREVFSQAEGEISWQGLHAGTGLDAHYHADPHSAALANDNTDQGLSFYNADDYSGRSHPPITTIGLDGVAGYGFYLEGDNISDGATVALDEFGAHEHGDYGYHYHATSTEETTSLATPFDTHKLTPLGAWAGRILQQNYNGISELPSLEVGEGDPVNRWVGNGTGP